ncbi:MAG: hypothetical protein RH860_02550 [Cytophagales bacterium]
MAESTRFKDFGDWFLKPFRKESKSVWRIFALCFFTATVFWVFNSLNKSYTTVINFPLNIVYDDENFIPVNDLPNSTKMEVSGFGWDLLRWSFGFGLEPMTLIPDDYENNSLSLNNYRNSISEKLGQVKLNKFINDSLYLDFDRKIEKKLSLSVDESSLKFVEGHRLQDSIIIVPDSVSLTGPKSILENLRDNFKISLPDREIAEDFDEQIELDFISNPLVSLTRETVNVYFKVERIIDKQMNISIEAVNFPEGDIKIIPESVDFRFKVSEQKFDAIEFDSLIVIADYNKLNSRDSSIKLELKNIPELLEETVLSQDSVKISVQ